MQWNLTPLVTFLFLVLMTDTLCFWNFWNWASKTRLFEYPSGHTDDIFQTKIMPFTDDCGIVTSAGDGQVRLGLLWEDDNRVDTTMLGKHHGCVYKLAVEPGSPHLFYSSGEDGFIQHVSQVLQHVAR